MTAMKNKLTSRLDSSYHFMSCFTALRWSLWPAHAASSTASVATQTLGSGSESSCYQSHVHHITDNPTTLCKG